MGAFVRNTLASFPNNRSNIIELVGPAGAGKSTLARALCQRSDKIAIGKEIALRQSAQLPVLVRSIPLVLTSVTTRAPGNRRWTWDEIKFLIYLDQWDRVIKKQADSLHGIILLDHGPIFKLTTLHAFGPEWLRSASAENWWKALFLKWAALLNLIVWLDAPDASLETRINERSQKHQVKGKTVAEVKQFLASYRASYDFVLSGIAASNGPHLIRFDTSQGSLDEITRNILIACKLEHEVGI